MSVSAEWSFEWRRLKRPTVFVLSLISSLVLFFVSPSRPLFAVCRCKCPFSSTIINQLYSASYHYRASGEECGPALRRAKAQDSRTPGVPGSFGAGPSDPMSIIILIHHQPTRTSPRSLHYYCSPHLQPPTQHPSFNQLRRTYHTAAFHPVSVDFHVDYRTITSHSHSLTPHRTCLTHSLTAAFSAFRSISCFSIPSSSPLLFSRQHGWRQRLQERC